MSSADRSAARPPAPRPPLRWRTSSYSDRGNCVAVARVGDGDVAVRNSNHPEAGAVHLAPTSLRAWIDGIKAGEFDHLT
jgi:hypothetical protein